MSEEAWSRMRKRGQEQAPVTRPPQRPLQAPAVPPVSSGRQPDSEGIAFAEVDITDAWAPALRAVIELRDKIEAEEWVNIAQQNAVLTGIKMAIQKLANEATKR